jgi:hypothetical protein
MSQREEFEMTEDDLQELLDAMRPVPMIAIQYGMGRSAQEMANDAWGRLGKKMGFDHMTVKPSGKGNRFFTAISVRCKGFEISPDVYSGCDASAGDCPECGK